jgi:hypothetical protein
LLARHADRFLEFSFFDELGKFWRPGYIGALTNQDVNARLLCERL